MSDLIETLEISICETLPVCSCEPRTSQSQPPRGPALLTCSSQMGSGPTWGPLLGSPTGKCMKYANLKFTAPTYAV